MKILVADDHDLIRKGIGSALCKYFDDTNVLEASNGAEVRLALKSHLDLDLVLLDLHMPDTEGLELVAYICKQYPDLTVVVVSAAEDDNSIRMAIDYGACGYLPKSLTEPEMVEALKRVFAGGVFVPNLKKKVHGVDSPGLANCMDLTGRQRQVLQLMGQGCTNKTIAANLNLSEFTIKIHVTAVLKTLGASNRTQAVIKARQLGLLEINN